jgi:hypothetical protein
MARKSKREIQREIESLESDGGRVENPILFVTETEEGETVDLDGEPVSEAELDRAGIIFNYTSESENYQPDSTE